MYVRTFLNWLVAPLRPLELEILSAVAATLPTPIADRFRAQVDTINYVQRRVGGREVGLYVIRGGKVARDPELSLPVGRREWRLARLRLSGAHQTCVATVWLADGHVSSIEYDEQPPRDASSRAADVEIFLPPSGTPQPSGSAPTLPEWLRPYADRFGVERIDPPLRPEDRAVLIARFETSMPRDYLELLERCNAVSIGPLALEGPDEAYEVRTEDAELLVLGEIGGQGIVGVRKPGPEIVFVEHDGGAIRDLGNSLAGALKQLLPS